MRGRFTAKARRPYDIAAMAEEPRDDPGSAPGEPVIFDARLTPHRSLSERGFLVLMAAVCLISFAAGLVFFLVGAWPVIGFLGLDVGLIYLAFRINYRRGTTTETLRLTPSSLIVDQVDPRGRARRWRFQAHWLQVLMDDPPRHHSQLVLRSHGRSLTIASFLTARERGQVATALKQALDRLRGAPG